MPEFSTATFSLSTAPSRPGPTISSSPVLHGELTVKRLKKSNGALVLYAENPAFPDIALDDAGCEAWGVVTHSIRRHCAR